MTHLGTRQSEGTSRRRVIAKLGPFLTAACVAVGAGLWVFSRTIVGVDAQLAAIDAAHAVPPGENATDDWAALRITNQLCSQARSTEYVAGWAVGRTVVEPITSVAANYHVPDAWLAKFETEIDAIDGNRRERFQEYARVMRLYMRKHGRSVPRLVQTLIGLIPGRADGVLLGTEATLVKLRGARIVFALRRYKDAKGEWPRSLSEIQAGLPHEALVDPLSKQPFAYRQGHDSFVLYGVGSNGIDDGGNIRDDYLLWPR